MKKQKVTTRNKDTGKQQKENLKLEDLEYTGEISDECRGLIDYVRDYYLRYVVFWRHYAKIWRENWLRTKGELEECWRDQEIVHPCVQANIDYENVFGKHTKLGDAIQTLEDLSEVVYDLYPKDKSLDTMDRIKAVNHILADVHDTLRDAYRKFQQYH